MAAIAGSHRDILDKVTVAGNIPVKKKIGDITFLCGTLWTDYDKGNIETHALVSRCISDHRTILNDDRTGVTPTQFAEIHNATVAKFGEWMEGQDNSKTVICTHHMPSFDAVDPQYLLDPTTRRLNHAFATHLNDFILKYQPAMWTFGHTHTKFFSKIGETQLVCNPLGYPQENNLSRGRFITENVFSL
jgi:hypothetical protein